MTDIELMDKMIQPTARVPLEAHYSKHKVVLHEPRCPTSAVEVRNLPQDAVVIKGDKFPEPNALFIGSKGECMRADYIVVAEKNGRTVIIYIELKNSNSSTLSDIQKQLRGAFCLVSYCKTVGQEFWQEQTFLADPVHRFVSFGHTSSIRKRATRETRTTKLHDRPDRLLKLDWAVSVEFNRLAGQV